VESHQEQVGDVTVIELLSEYLDAGNSGDLKNILADLAGDHRKLVLDLNRVTFVDSSGCGALIAALPRVHSAGGELKLCCINPPVRTLFDIVRMQRILDIHKTRDDALAAFAR
jgi:anti-sigma B factor antagonist